MIKSLTDQNFDRIIEQSTVPVLVEFWQPGCKHCQALLTELEMIHNEMGTRLEIFKLNVQENFLIPGELEIQSLPTLALYHDGTFQKFIGGTGKKEPILEQIASYLD